MPTYEYLCDNCSHAFEKFQSITASNLRKCPECGKLKLKRLIGTGSGIIFKGSGFYGTDYRSENYKKAQENDKPKATETKDKKGKKAAETKSETKPKKETAKPTAKDKKAS